MKAPLLVLIVLLSGGAGAVGGILAQRGTTSDASPVTDHGPTALVPGARADDAPPIDKQARALATDTGMVVALLEERIADLETEITSLRSRLDREPVAQAEEAPAVQLASVKASDREMVLAVLEEERLREERERDERRAQREQEQIERKASRAVERLGLDANAEAFLVDFYTREEQREDDARELMETMGRDRETRRAMAEEMNAWKRQELTGRFDTETVEKILGLDDRGRGRRRGN